MRLRSLLLLIVGALGVRALLSRRAPAEFVDVDFEDGSALRLARGAEAKDLLDDAHAILELA
jgi:hypothetical protein